jgi:predicted Zn finger-like uncharacterized protein
MKITCQSCQAKYNVADEKVQGKIVKIRCRKCGATIVAQGNGGGANGTASRGPTPPAAFAGDDVQWHVNLGDNDPRTMTLRELIDAYNSSVVTQDTFIWTDGMDDWKPLSEVESVVAALHADAAADAAPPSAYEVAPTAQAEPAPAPAPLPAFQSSSVGEAMQPAYEAPTTIGAFAMQGQVEAPVEPKRAAVKREARSRDLFASRVANEDVQTSAPVAPHIMSSALGAGSAGADASKLTGERNENSVLFSLAVLTKDSGGSDDAPAAPAKNVSEDSGLIDLKALALKAESVRPKAPAASDMFAPPLGLASGPLGAPLGAFGVAAEEKPKSMLPLLIGGGAGAAVLGVLCVFVGMKLAGSGSAATAPSAAPSASAPVAATVDPSATASAAPAATAEASASASATAAAPKPKPVQQVVHAVAPGATAKPAATGAAPAATAAAPPPKKTGTTDCGCNGDLMCLMKCSAH